MISQYCRRIGLAELPPPTVAGLGALQLAQRLAIPFENLDILLDREIKLDHESIFDKMMTGGRGGYCFEQNLLLAYALQEMGIAHRPALARVWLGTTDVRPLTHLVLLAKLDDAIWLMDAGFGGGYCPPMLLTNGFETTAPDGNIYRLTRDLEMGWFLDRRADGDVVRQFSFTETQVHAVDIQLSNHWTSTHPSSRFRQNMIVNKVTENGRISLTNTVLTHGGTGKDITTVTSQNQLADILHHEFGLKLPAKELRILAKHIHLPSE